MWDLQSVWPLIIGSCGSTSECMASSSGSMASPVCHLWVKLYFKLLRTNSNFSAFCLCSHLLYIWYDLSCILLFFNHSLNIICRVANSDNKLQNHYRCISNTLHVNIIPSYLISYHINFTLHYLKYHLFTKNFRQEMKLYLSLIRFLICSMVIPVTSIGGIAVLVPPPAIQPLSTLVEPPVIASGAPNGPVFPGVWNRVECCCWLYINCW